MARTTYAQRRSVLPGRSRRWRIARKTSILCEAASARSMQSPALPIHPRSQRTLMRAVACSRCGLQRRSSRRAPTRTRTCNGRLYPQMRPGIGWLGSGAERAAVLGSAACARARCISAVVSAVISRGLGLKSESAFASAVGSVPIRCCRAGLQPDPSVLLRCDGCRAAACVRRRLGDLWRRRPTNARECVCGGTAHRDERHGQDPAARGARDRSDAA